MHSRRAPSFLSRPMLLLRGNGEYAGEPRPLAKMSNGLERIIDQTALHLFAIKRVTSRIIVRCARVSLLQLFERGSAHHAWHGHRFAIMLRQFIRRAKFIFTCVVFSQTKPGIGYPVGMLFRLSRQFVQVAPIRPKGKEGKFFRLAQVLQVRIFLRIYRAPDGNVRHREILSGKPKPGHVDLVLFPRAST